MRNIRVSDMTLKLSGTAGNNVLSFREQIEIAKLLDKLNVSVIELLPVKNKKTDCLLIKSVASTVVNSSLCVPVELGNAENIELTWNALKFAAHPRLQVICPVSTVQMEYFYHKKPQAMLEMIKYTVAECKKYCPDVEFVADDSGRCDKDFLYETFSAATEAGATTITVCDTAGNMLSEECYSAIRTVRSKLPEGVALGVFSSNNMYMADACIIAAIRAGADEVKVTSSGKSTASLKRIVNILIEKGDVCDVKCPIGLGDLNRTLEQIRMIAEAKRSKLSPFDTGVRDYSKEECLTAHDDISAVKNAAVALGYDLNDDDLLHVFEAFSKMASLKEKISVKELDAIIASAAMQVPPTYKLESYVINSGNVITATAHIKIRKGDKILDGLSIGDGSIDAALIAIEKILGCHYELDDFQIRAVTEGREAMGETVVRLRANGKLYSGRGISTDIIGSSISAYINAVNKIVFEEE